MDVVSKYTIQMGIAITSNIWKWSIHDQNMSSGVWKVFLLYTETLPRLSNPEYSILDCSYHIFICINRITQIYCNFWYDKLILDDNSTIMWYSTYHLLNWAQEYLRVVFRNLVFITLVEALIVIYVSTCCCCWQDSCDYST